MRSQSTVILEAHACVTGLSFLVVLNIEHEHLTLRVHHTTQHQCLMWFHWTHQIFLLLLKHSSIFMIIPQHIKYQINRPNIFESYCVVVKLLLFEFLAWVSFSKKSNGLGFEIRAEFKWFLKWTHISAVIYYLYKSVFSIFITIKSKDWWTLEKCLRFSKFFHANHLAKIQFFM